MTKTYWNSEKNTDQTRNEFCEPCKKTMAMVRLIPVLGLISILGIGIPQVQAQTDNSGNSNSNNYSHNQGYTRIHVPTYEYRLNCHTSTCWYNAGYLDGRWDHQHGMGSSFACPRSQDIAPNYCRGYSNGWDSVNNGGSDTSKQGQSSSVTIHGSNNKVEVTQSQGSQQ